MVSPDFLEIFMEEYYVYILKSEITKRYYIGATENLRQRLKEHNAGRVKSTKLMIPWRIKYYERYATVSEARIREKQIKNWKKRLAIERLIKAHSSSG